MTSLQQIVWGCPCAQVVLNCFTFLRFHGLISANLKFQARDGSILGAAKHDSKAEQRRPLECVGEGAGPARVPRGEATRHREAESRRDQDKQARARPAPHGLWERPGGAGASPPPGPGLSAPIGGAPARFLPPPLRRGRAAPGSGRKCAPASQAALGASPRWPLGASESWRPPARPPAASPARPHPVGTR